MYENKVSSLFTHFYFPGFSNNSSCKIRNIKLRMNLSPQNTIMKINSFFNFDLSRSSCKFSISKYLINVSSPNMSTIKHKKASNMM